MKKSILLIAIILFCFLDLLNAQDGTLDLTFNPGAASSANNDIYASAIQNDGKIVIGGGFTSYNFTVINRIARLKTDGTLDAAFYTGVGADNVVRSIAIETYGKIIIGGDFHSYNGTPRNHLVRLNIDGSIDPVFNPGTGANNIVYCISTQSDGKIIIGGNFTSYNGTARNYIARINSDGSLDATFNPGTGANGEIFYTSIQSDDKIIISGKFTTYNGTTVNRIARLNSDGTLDATFITGTGANDTIKTTAIQSDGKIIIGGAFTSYNGTTRNRIARLNTNGSIDATFNPGTAANKSVFDISIQNDGKIIIAGNFTTYSGSARNRIARLNSNGALDATFDPGTGADYIVYTTCVQSDSRIIAGGSFRSYNGKLFNRITRLNVNGTSDDSFNPGVGPDGSVITNYIQNDGKIIIGGYFTSFNGYSRNRIARLNANGTLDTTFNPGTGTNGHVRSISVQSNGKIIVCGYFTTFNGTTRNCIARLNADGSLDASFNPGTGADDLVWTSGIQSDGKIVIGGDFTTFNGVTKNGIARLNSNGTLDDTFNSGTGLGQNAYACVMAIQNDGKIIIGGGFGAYNGTGASHIVRINTDGTIDASFNSGAGAESMIYAMSIQNDGKIIIGGAFRAYNNITTFHIARINTNGSLDASFNVGTGTNYSVYTSSIQKNGKIIIGGYFITYNGTTTNHIARLNEDGTLDVTFCPGTAADYEINCTNIQSDGKIVIGGRFFSYNGTTRNYIARLNGTPTGLQENILGNNFSIYPNPSNGNFTLELHTSKPEKVMINIMNLSGISVYESQYSLISGNNSQTITLKDISPGIYFVTVKGEKTNLVKKIVIQ